MCDRGESWMLQQSHESDPDANVLISGRKAFRTNEMMPNDMQQAPIVNHSGNDHGARGNQIVAQDMDYDSHNVHQRSRSGVQYSADGNRAIVQHDERASDATVRIFPAVDQRRAEVEHQANGRRAISGVQHSAGQRPSVPYAPYTATPAPKITPMSYRNEAHTARHPVVAYATNDIMPMMLVATPIADSEARGSQSSAMRIQHTPVQQSQRTLVKDKVAALETNIKRFGQDTTKGPTLYHLSSLDDGDSADWPRQTSTHHAG
jgi:hypothetical protein